MILKLQQNFPCPLMSYFEMNSINQKEAKLLYSIDLHCIIYWQCEYILNNWKIQDF